MFKTWRLRLEHAADCLGQTLSLDHVVPVVPVVPESCALSADFSTLEETPDAKCFGSPAGAAWSPIQVVISPQSQGKDVVRSPEAAMASKHRDARLQMEELLAYVGVDCLDDRRFFCSDFAWFHDFNEKNPGKWTNLREIRRWGWKNVFDFLPPCQRSGLNVSCALASMPCLPSWSRCWVWWLCGWTLNSQLGHSQVASCATESSVIQGNKQQEYLQEKTWMNMEILWKIICFVANCGDLFWILLKITN